MWRTPGLVPLFVAKLISTCGSWLTVLALPWFVLVTTGSPVRMSAVLIAEYLGVVLLGLPSGRVVERLGVRRTMLLGDAARVPLMASIPVLHQAGWLSLPVLLTVSFGLGIFTAPYVASQRLILADLLGSAGADEGRLARANSLIDAATRIAALAGPAVGGVLIAVAGPAEVLWIDAGTYGVSLLIVLFFVRPPAPGSPRPRVTRGTATSMSAGLRHALRHRVLRRFLLALVLVCVAVSAITASLPVLVVREMGADPRILGLLTAANGAGLALGSLVAVAGLARLGDGALTGAAVLISAPLWLLLTGRTGPLVAALFLIGLATPVLAATINTRFTLRTPVELRPHAMTAMATVENLAYFVAFAAAGPVLQTAGLGPVFAAIAVLASLGAIAFVAALRADHRTRTGHETPENRPGIMRGVLTLKMNDAAAQMLGTVDGLPALPAGLRNRLERGLIRRGAVLTWADSTGEAEGAPSFLADLTAWECADSSFHLEDAVPVDVAVVDDAPVISAGDQRTLLVAGLAFAFRFGRLVRALDPPGPVRCIVAANDTNATFRFHQIRPGEQWNLPDLDSYHQDRTFVLDIEPASAR